MKTNKRKICSQLPNRNIFIFLVEFNLLSQILVGRGGHRDPVTQRSTLGPLNQRVSGHPAVQVS